MSVLIRVIEGLIELAQIAATERQRMGLARHAALIRRACGRNVPEQADRAEAERPLRRLDAALGEPLASDAGPQGLLP